MLEDESLADFAGFVLAVGRHCQDEFAVAVGGEAVPSLPEF